MADNQTDIDQLLHDGMVAAERGDRETAQALLFRVVEQDSANEAAWWWLSLVVDDVTDQITAAENALALNPNHREAQKRLTELRAAPQQATPEWKSLLPEASNEEVDESDNPFQCPQCGRVTEERVRRCPHCGRGLWRRVQTSTGSPSFQILRLMWVVGIGVALVDILPPAFTLSLAQGQGPGLGLESLEGIFGINAFLGRFSQMPVETARWVLTGQLVQAGALIVLLVGLNWHWALAYYWSLLALVAAIAWNVFLLFGGYLGVGGAAFALVMAIILLVLLFACAPEFPINDERILVRADGKARSALDFYMLGHRYRKQGLWALAVAQWRRATGLAPKMAPYYKDLGVGYAQLNRFERSLRALRQAQREAPEDVDIAEVIKLVEDRQTAHRAARQKK